MGPRTGRRSPRMIAVSRSCAVLFALSVLALAGCSSDGTTAAGSPTSVAATSTSRPVPPSAVPTVPDAPGVTLPVDPTVCPRLRDAALLLVPEIVDRELPESPFTATDLSHTADTIECRAPFAVDEQGNPFGSAHLTVATLAAILAETGAADLWGAITSAGYRCVPSATPIGDYATVLFCDTPGETIGPSAAIAVGSGTLAAFYVVGADGKATLPGNETMARAMAVILGVA